MESTTRCADVSVAMDFIHALIRLRAEREALELRMTQALSGIYIRQRTAELVQQCANLGYPKLIVTGISMSFHLKDTTDG